MAYVKVKNDPSLKWIRSVAKRETRKRRAKDVSQFLLFGAVLVGVYAMSRVARNKPINPLA